RTQSRHPPRQRLRERRSQAPAAAAVRGGRSVRQQRKADQHRACWADKRVARAAATCPKDPDRAPRPRSLPDTALKVIAANLGLFEEPCGISERRITELPIDTGRRPDEVCTLRWDCLE